MAGKSDEFEQISAYLDGELPEEERREIELWLERDPKARQILDDLRRVSGLVASLPRESGPTDLAFTIRSQVERDALLGDTLPRRRVRRARAVGWATRLGAVAVVILGATLAWFSVEQTQNRVAENAAAPGQVANRSISDSVNDDGPTNKVRRPRARAHGRELLQREKTVASAEAPPGDTRDSRARRGRRTRSMDAADDRLRPKRAPAAGGNTQERLAFSRSEYDPLHGGRRLDGVAFRKNEFDVRLHQNVLTQEDLRNNLVDVSPANRIIVETDLRSAEAMVEVINGFMTANGIPAADSDDVPEPIPADQIFFFNRPANWNQEDAEVALEDNADEPDVYVMNVYPQQAELLFVSIDSFATLNRSKVKWHANWVHDTEPQPLRDIIQSINGNIGGTAGAVGDTKRGDTTLASAEPTPIVDERDAPQGDKGKFGKSSRYASTQAQDGAPITFAIEIRTRKKAGGEQILQFPPPFAPSTSQPAERSTTATQPTSQRSEGG